MIDLKGGAPWGSPPFCIFSTSRSPFTLEMANLPQTRIAFSRCGERLAPPAITKLMATALASPELLSLAAGFTDNTTLPVEPVREIVDALLNRPGCSEVLQYGTNQGRTRLRELLARRISNQDGLSGDDLPGAEQMFITNGSQQALALMTQVLCDPGDIVLVEKPTYFVYLDVLRGLGVRAVSLPLDEDKRLDPVGLERLLDELERGGELERVKAVYLLAYYANPSSATLDEAEKNGLAEVLARRELFLPIIEDAAYRELYYAKPPPPRSVLALERFEPFPLLYLGTLTKSFASGLKVGFGCCTSKDWLDRILFLKGQHDFGTSNFGQAIMEEVLAGPYFEEHLVNLRRHYEAKMRALHEVLVEEGLPEAGWKWDVPDGGLYLWLEGPRGLDTGIESPFCQQCLDNGILYVPGSLCFGDTSETHFVRLSFGVLSPSDLREAGRRFAKSVRECG